MSFRAHPEDSDLGLEPGQRYSRFTDIERLQRGPEPYPDWLITDGAIETDCGVLKTGKEAEVSLLERSTGSRAHLMAAKRYRGLDNRDFRRDTVYTEGRTTRNTRDRRALAAKSDYGRSVAAGQWAVAEFDALSRLWRAGVPVPYPIQIDGTEILMEFIADPNRGAEIVAAPRLHTISRGDERLPNLWRQLTDAMGVIARLGYAHGDLSPYNILVSGQRLVLIDVPQLVDVTANPFGVEILQRDCRNVCSWFTGRGVGTHGIDADPDVLLAELLGQVW